MSPITPAPLSTDDVLRHIPSGVLVFDAVGQVTHINPACLELFRLRLHPAELIGQGWRRFFEQIAPQFADAEAELARVKSLIHQDSPDAAEIALRDGRLLLRHYVPIVHRRDIVGAVWQLQDVSAIKEQQRQLEFLTERDPLTGLLNRRGFDRRLTLLERHPLGQHGFTLALLDLDDFKRVNDTLGHAAGDAVLAEVGNRLKALVRLTDMPARIGGDEFAILMPECRTEEQAVAVGDRLRHMMDAPFTVDGVELRLACSVGLAVQRGSSQGQCALFQRADLALYDAKQAGRNRFKLFSQRLKHQYDTLNQQRDLLRQALDQGRLELYYQPILTLSDDASGPMVRKFEVLLRLRDARGQLRRAEEFESALADPQLGTDVDRYVLDTALRQMRDWQRQGLDLRLAVNISPHHFSHPDFVPTVRSLLQTYPQIAPQRLSLEITEHGPALSLRVVSATILELRRMGLSISLDDFGTGNASLAHLQQFDVSVVKIDRSFVRELLRDGVDMSLSYGMLRLAQMLGIGAIAEGVETRAQCRALSLLGFRHLQGYLFAQPMPADDVPGWLVQAPEQLAWLRDLSGPMIADAERAVQALVTHRMRARKLLSRTLDAAEAQELRHPDALQRCDLGRWLTAHAAQWGQAAQYQRLVQAHQRFHQCMTAALDQNDTALDLQLSQASEEVHAAFWEWILFESAHSAQAAAGGEGK